MGLCRQFKIEDGDAQYTGFGIDPFRAGTSRQGIETQILSLLGYRQAYG
jgi:hypothetical protein